MDKLVVIAEKEELKLVEELGYGDWQVLITGVGAMNVIKALKDLPKDMTIVNIGYAGSKDLEPGKYYAVDKSFLYLIWNWYLLQHSVSRIWQHSSM